MGINGLNNFLKENIPDINTKICLSKFKKMNAALKKEDWKEAAKEGRDSRWYNQVTKRAERLMSRLENVS